MAAELSYDRPSGGWQIPAKLVSYLFHPLFMPLYYFGWLALRFAWQFPGMEEGGWSNRWMQLTVNTVFFPAFVVFLLWRLKFIDNIFLRTQKERIIPYITTMFFYWWIYYLSRNFTDQPDVVKAFFFGNFLCISGGLIANSFFKISMHAMGMGGLLTGLVLTCADFGVYLGTDLIIAMLLAGLVGTARLFLNHHSPFHVYAGYVVAIAAQLIGFWYVLG